MRTPIAPLLFFYVLGTLFSLNAQTSFYVAPSGNDANDGSPDTPFKSIEKAQSEARKQTGEITIYLREGVFRLEKAIVFTPLDSKGDKKLTLRSYPGEQAVISGAVELKPKWEKYKNGILKARIDPAIDMDMLTVNGKIRPPGTLSEL